MKVQLKCRQCGVRWELEPIDAENFLNTLRDPQPSYRWVHLCGGHLDTHFPRQMGISDLIGYTLSEEEVDAP